ncbi:hypothetical protein GGI20_000791 [Coemansia sp. BCRC 34301]|nr:hypothetical protein GGI20_000791 [Coemansia sp. BCRC 34301]
MRFLPLVAIIATTAVLGTAFANAQPAPAQHQALFDINRPSNSNGAAVEMSEHYTFDTNAQGPPELIDILAMEKSATTAMDAIMQSEALVRAISGDSADFKTGLTLLLPTNEAFRRAKSTPTRDLELVMQRHFIPQLVSLESMAEGATVDSYKGAASLRFSSKQGTVYVRADGREDVPVRGSGVQAGNGTYFLVDQLFV